MYGIDKIKSYLAALLIGFFNPYPARIAGAVAVLVVLANLLGMCAAVKRGEKVSGHKILKGNIRLLIYFASFAALYHALKSTFFAHLLSGIYSAIALYEFALLLQKASDCGIIPQGVIKAARNAISKHSNT